MSDLSWAAISSIATSIAAAISLIAVFIALRTAKHMGDQANLLRDQIAAGQALLKIEVHSRFQSEARAIQRTFSANVNNANWTPTDAERRSISLYWYLVFDEWLTCTQMHISLTDLWSKQYSEGVKSALRIPEFKACAVKLFQGSSSFFGYGQAFRAEIERLCYEGTGRPLF
jgi:hypothetical protein